MDRLLVGDVGFGKTEVALRAAFKAIKENKQVAFLVPTTILAQQHFDTMTERFENFPVNVAMLSRFRTKNNRMKQSNKSVQDKSISWWELIGFYHRICSLLI